MCRNEIVAPNAAFIDLGRRRDRGAHEPAAATAELPMSDRARPTTATG